MDSDIGWALDLTLKCLGSGNLGVTTAVTVYTVPAGKTTTLMEMRASNKSGSSASFDVYINDATADRWIVRASGIATSATIVLSMRTVLAAGHILKLQASVANWDYWVSGDES